MNITTTILTVGTALRHAHAQELPVHVLCGQSWMIGRVIGLDGEGVALFTPDEETLVVRIASISAVRIKGGVVDRGHDDPRPRYDGLNFPAAGVPADLMNLGVAPTPSRHQPPVYEPEPEPEPSVPVVSPYPVGHPARSGR